MHVILLVLQEGAEPLVWCKSSCGNNMHKVCFDQWAKSKRNQGQQVTCVYCRAVWALDEKAGESQYGVLLACFLAAC